MSQRRYGGGGSGSGGTASVGAAGTGGAAVGSGSSPTSTAGGSSIAQQTNTHKATVTDENEDTERAELVDEMGRLSPVSSPGGASGTAGGRGANSIVRAFRSSGKQAGLSSSGACLVVIWLFIAVSLLCTMMSGSIGGIGTMHRIGGGGADDSAAFGETNVWVNGSGRTDLSYKTVFNPDDLTMTSDECDAFFPDLYKEVDRSKQYYTHHTTFDRAYLERTCDDGVWTHARVVIYNNRLYIKYYQPAGFTRGEAALALLHQSLITSREKLPNVEFCIGLHDWGSMGKFSLDRPPEVEDVWLMPDYSFWSWPEHVGMYNEMREKERKIDQQIGWQGKKNTLFWRGSMKVGTEDREALMAAAQGHAWNEMSEIVWGSPDKGPILLEDHCKYKFHAYPDGNTYSGRLRYLQNCAVVVVTHPQKWIQHYTHLFNGEWGHPDQNIVYIPGPLDNDPDKGVMVHNAEGKEVGRRRNWERLPEVMESLLKDDAMAKRIANNVLKTFRDRYVVPATAMCYWRRSLRSFAAVQKYDVSLDGTETSYENFLLHGMRKPEDIRN